MSRRTARPAVEALEARDLMTVTMQIAPVLPDLLTHASVGYNATTRAITVFGSSDADKVRVALIDTNGNGLADPTDYVSVSVQSSKLASEYRPVVMPIAAVSKISAFLGGGDDVYDCDARIPVEQFVDGGYGDDQIYAGAGNDVLIGGYGSDILYGRGGNDDMSGDKRYGSSADWTREGNDFLNGGTGTNTLYFGGGHNDDYEWAGGHDVLLDLPESMIAK